jgi:succinyl-CoA synthetase alpha subunit
MNENKYTKPFVSYIAGRSLPAGIRFSHASAIVKGVEDTAEGKEKFLRDAGAHVVTNPLDIAPTVVNLLRE